MLEVSGTKKDITLLVISGIALVLSLAKIQPFPFDMAWIAIVLCGVPIILTYGNPEITEVVSIKDSYADDVLLNYSAGVENMSEHPLGKAIVCAVLLIVL